MKNDIIEFEIPHYEKYHPKKGYKKNPWVRIDVDIWDDPKCSQLAAWEMSCWIYLITCCGRNNTGMSSCSLRNGASRVRVKPHLMLRAIEHLEQLQLLKVLNRTQMGANERNERTNVTNVTNERDRGQRAFALKSAPPPKEKNSHWLAELWNSHRGKLPFCRIPVSPQRLKLIKARVKSEPDPKVWADVIQRLAESRFCNGENDRGWVAD